VRRDIITIGASAGGVGALSHLLSRLPGDLPAAVLVVQHLSAGGGRGLAAIFDRAGKLPVKWADRGETIAPGTVYVAPPDLHLLVDAVGVRLNTGARESFARPSINRLFRTAAAAYGSRVIGVLLTGLLQDGVDGLRAIRRVGGLTIAQRPGEAHSPDLPLAAIQAGVVELVLGLDELAERLPRLVGEDAMAGRIPDDLVAEAAMDLEAPPDPRRMTAIGERTNIMCPDCGGPLWAGGDERTRSFRCYLGHAHDIRQLLETESHEVERALWIAVRSLHDRAATLDVLASDSRRMGNILAAESFAKRADETRGHADRAREFLLRLQHVSATGT
jgi:two-component system chemotaxis response regulator CheB